MVPLETAPAWSEQRILPKTQTGESRKSLAADHGRSLRGEPGQLLTLKRHGVTGPAPLRTRGPAARIPADSATRTPTMRRFGHYRLIQRLGQGRQGQVWKAIQLEPIVETVALKLLSPSLALDPGRLEQFHREAEVGAQLESPSLLPTYEFGKINGIVYMTMPLVNGDSLADVIVQTRQRAAGRMSATPNWWNWLSEEAYLRSMVRVVGRIARALDVAHVNRVVHRDIKPANILLDRDREDRVYLCDFGLSRDLDGSPQTSTRFGTGTPLYMAPEKLVGCATDDVLCDVYALGVTLFEALTRVHPFSIPDDLPASEWAAHLALSTPRRIQAVNPRISEPLVAVVLKAMSRDPAGRYPSAAALADDLERLADLRNLRL